jgi:KDEL-tailed cysteine endopeptidase
MKVFVGLLALIALGSVVSQSEHVIYSILDNFIEGPPKMLFKVWHLLHKKSYSLDTTEAINRYRIFKENLAEIKAHNAQPGNTYTLGLNQYSDLTKEEFKKLMTRKPTKASDLQQLSDNMNTNTKFLNDDDDDLTKRNLQSYAEICHAKYLGTPRNQGYCGSCWAFASAGVVEGVHGVKNKAKIEYVSTQQLVDCSTDDNGCNGGGSFSALNYIKLNGVEPDTAYTYKEADGTCAYNKMLATRRIVTWDYCSNYDTRKCSFTNVYNLLTRGPALVGIDGSAIQSYRSGVFTGTCTYDNHAVVLVGYGVDVSTGIAYWKVRNSWGGSWGEAGHIRVKVQTGNNSSCYVANEAIIPLL